MAPNGISTQSEKLINYDELSKEFTGYYSEFDVALKRSPFRNPHNEDPCYAFLGVSGAGKTTILARLLSNLPPDDFYSKIRDRSGDNSEMVSLEGVTIGHSANSTTVVPKIYSLAGGKLHVCDMPGFAETDPQKRITINILQKCLLTRVKGTTFLAVLDVNEIFTTRPKTIVDAYHQPLLDLLGDKYDTAIDHLCFILTKNDAPDGQSYTEEQIQNEIMRKGFEMTMAGGGKEVKLLYRIKQRHVFVNMTEDTKEDVLAKIQGMIELDQRQRNSVGRVQEFSIEHLDAGENTLNRLSYSHSVALTGRLEELTAKLGQKKLEVDQRKQELRAESDSLKLEKEESLSEASKIDEELRQVTAEIKGYEPERARVQAAIKEAEDLLGTHKRQSALFQKHTVDEDLINIRCDVSRQVTRGMRNVHNVKLNADVASDRSTDFSILVMDYEPHDDTLKSYINRDGSLIPKTLKQIGEIDFKSVLYNSATARNKCDAKVDEINGVVSIEVTRDTPFKVYIYSARRFSEMDLFKDLQQRFHAEQKNDLMKIEKLNDQLVEMKKKHEANSKRRIKLDADLAAALDELELLKAKAKAMQTSHHDSCDAMTTALEKIQTERAQVENDPKVANIAKIEKIFRDNKIQNALSPAIAAFNDSNRELHSGISTTISAVQHFRSTQNELIQDLLVSNWQVTAEI